MHYILAKRNRDQYFHQILKDVSKDLHESGKTNKIQENVRYSSRIDFKHMKQQNVETIRFNIEDLETISFKIAVNVSALSRNLCVNGKCCHNPDST